MVVVDVVVAAVFFFFFFCNVLWLGGFVVAIGNV